MSLLISSRRVLLIRSQVAPPPTPTVHNIRVTDTADTRVTSAGDTRVTAELV
jgi:hypothetical protein